MHDFDVDGLAIAKSLDHDTRRYQFEFRPNLIDIGLRLADVKKMRLQSEPTEFKQQKDPGEKLLDYHDVTQEEIDFLVERQVNYNKWCGKRVELNAMTSDRFIRWLEDKLKEHGVKKVIPDKKTLKDAWRRAQVLTAIKIEVQKIISKPPDTKPVPADLDKRLRKVLDREPELSWDKALVSIAGMRG